MNKKWPLVATLSSVAIIVFSFQNCSSPKGADTVAISCLKVSVFKAKYGNASPQFDISAGGTCSNSTNYNTIKYDAATDKMILSGLGMSSLSYSLDVGSGSCNQGTVGGDTWVKGADRISTNLGSTSLQVAISGSVDISCSNIPF